jgi:hypothetical protein
MLHDVSVCAYACMGFHFSLCACTVPIVLCFAARKTRFLEMLTHNSYTVHSFPNLFRCSNYSVGRQSQVFINFIGFPYTCPATWKINLNSDVFFSSNQGLATLLLQTFTIKCPPVWRKYTKQKDVLC